MTLNGAMAVTLRYFLATVHQIKSRHVHGHRGYSTATPHFGNRSILYLLYSNTVIRLCHAKKSVDLRKSILFCSTTTTTIIIINEFQQVLQNFRAAEVRVRCRRKESSRSLSRLLMSFLSLLL